MGRMLYILFMLLLVCRTAVGQKVGEPVWGLEMCEETSTNHNASVRLVDSVAIYAFDSLRKDGTATIVTVYETDEDSAVGLWEVGSGGNRALWLNTQSDSYEDFQVKYRQENEKGVIVHTMTYAYPQVDSNYTGKDTQDAKIWANKVGSAIICDSLGRPFRTCDIIDNEYDSCLVAYATIRLYTKHDMVHIDKVQVSRIWKKDDDDNFYESFSEDEEFYHVILAIIQRQVQEGLNGGFIVYPEQGLMSDRVSYAQFGIRCI